MEVTRSTALIGATGEVYIYRSNGNHETRTDKPGKLFAQLGEEGWELTTSNALTDKDFIYLFKRPVNDGS